MPVFKNLRGKLSGFSTGLVTKPEGFSLPKYLRQHFHSPSGAPDTAMSTRITLGFGQVQVLILGICGGFPDSACLTGPPLMLVLLVLDTHFE